MQDHDHDDTYPVEHGLAWLMSAFAIVLGIIGALEAFAVINLGDSIGVAGVTPSPSGDVDAFQDGALILLPALVAAFLAFALHRSEHHLWRHDWNVVPDKTTASSTEYTNRRRERGFWKGEHAAAYLATFSAILFSVIGLLVGFNLMDDNHSFYDGMTWEMLSLMSGILAAALHSVTHHQPAFYYDTVRDRLEERVSPTVTEVHGTGIRDSQRR